MFSDEDESGAGGDNSHSSFCKTAGRRADAFKWSGLSVVKCDGDAKCDDKTLYETTRNLRGCGGVGREEGGADVEDLRNMLLLLVGMLVAGGGVEDNRAEETVNNNLLWEQTSGSDSTKKTKARFVQGAKRWLVCIQ